MVLIEVDEGEIYDVCPRALLETDFTSVYEHNTLPSSA